MKLEYDTSQTQAQSVAAIRTCLLVYEFVGGGRYYKI
jgi:hypothetical protein